MSIEAVMLSNHLILCHLLLLLPSIFPSIRVFSSESALHIRWPKYWSFSFSNSPSNEYSELISFRIDLFDLFAVQETLESSPAPQFKSINPSVLSLLYRVRKDQTGDNEKTGNPGMHQSMGLQRVRHDVAAEHQQQTRDGSVILQRLRSYRVRGWGWWLLCFLCLWLVKSGVKEPASGSPEKKKNPRKHCSMRDPGLLEAKSEGGCLFSDGNKRCPGQ